MSPLFAAIIAMGGAAVLLVAVRLVGQWLAATHPDPEPVSPTSRKAAAQAPATDSGPAHGDLAAVIAAAVHYSLRVPVRIVSVSQVRPPTVESLMLQWSVEGRRAIYSSHRLR